MNCHYWIWNQQEGRVPMETFLLRLRREGAGEASLHSSHAEVAVRKMILKQFQAVPELRGKIG